MRRRSKVLMALWVGSLTMAVTAGGALAHGGDKSKGTGKAALKVEIRGAVSGVGATSISITAIPQAAPVAPVAPGAPAAPAAPIIVTCNVPAGTDLTAFPIKTRVKAKCKSDATGLNLKKLRTTDNLRDKVEIEAAGKVTAFTPAGATPGTIGVDTAVPGQTPVTCAVTDRTRVRSVPTMGAMVKVECKTKNGVLTAKKIKVKVNKVEAKGALTIGAGTVTVGALTCSVPAGTTVDPALAGKMVEIKCLGTPPVLAKIELEDDDDDH